MKNVIHSLLLVILFSNLKAQLPPFPPSVPNADSTSFYLPDGTKNWFHYQKDVAVFHMAGGAQFTDTLPAFVTSITWDPLDPYGYNIITFDTAAPGAYCQAYWYYIHGYTGFEYGFVPTTKNRYADANQNLWYMGNDKLLVQFKAGVTSAQITAFASRNLLTLVNSPDPSLPNAGDWTYIFQMLENQRFTPFDAASRIWYNEQTYVIAVEPDMKMMKSSFSCGSLPTEFAAWASTAHPDALWHIKNNGNTVYATLGAGIAGADTKVCQCWGAGYDGTGMKVAVIDVDGFDFTHPDMAGQFLPGWDCVNNVAITT